MSTQSKATATRKQLDTPHKFSLLLPSVGAGEATHADSVLTGLLEVGDEVFFKVSGSKSRSSALRVTGKSFPGKVVNSYRVEGVPYLAAVGQEMGWKNSISSYLIEPTRRVLEGKAIREGD